MLLELHFPKHTFTLKFLLQSAESLFDVVIADADLHVVFTTFLSLSCTRCAGRGRISDSGRLVYRRAGGRVPCTSARMQIGIGMAAQGQRH
jgi:hypothetical protein